jgi:hypothetical protein
MKRTLGLVTGLLIACTLGAQDVYTTTGGEWIFSFPNGEINGADASGPVRFAPVFNLQTYLHVDRGEKFGFLSGLALRNVGFIYDDPVIPQTRYKVRSYNIGIPLGIKVGNMTGTYVFAAYEFEFPIHYKRKTFVDEEKQDNKVTTWFSSQLPTVYQGVMVGVQVAQGAQLKFKYYLTDFYKKSYTDASSTQPWADFDASTMYVSLSMQILKGTDYVYKRGE